MRLTVSALSRRIRPFSELLAGRNGYLPLIGIVCLVFDAAPGWVGVALIVVGPVIGGRVAWARGVTATPTRRRAGPDRPVSAPKPPSPLCECGCAPDSSAAGRSNRTFDQFTQGPIAAFMRAIDAETWSGDERRSGGSPAVM